MHTLDGAIKTFMPDNENTDQPVEEQPTPVEPQPMRPEKVTREVREVTETVTREPVEPDDDNED